MDKNTVCDFRRPRFEPASGRRQKLREGEREREEKEGNLETGEQFDGESPPPMSRSLLFTAAVSRLYRVEYPATKRMEGKVPYLSILILGLVFASQEGKRMGGIPRVVDSTVGVLAAKLEILTCEF